MKDKILLLKEFLQKNYKQKQAFNTRNIVGDPMTTVYDKNGVIIDYCAYYDYVEIFGLENDVFNELLEDGSLSHLRDFSKDLKKI